MTGEGHASPRAPSTKHALVAIVATSVMAVAIWLDAAAAGQTAATRPHPPQPPRAAVVDSTGEAPDHARVPMRRALQSSRKLRDFAIGTTHPAGEFLCGFDRLGHSEARHERYLFILCGDFVSGRPVNRTTMSQAPMIVSVSGRLRQLRITRLRIIADDATASDIRDFYPPRPARQLIRGHIHVLPTERQLHDSL